MCIALVPVSFSFGKADKCEAYAYAPPVQGARALLGEYAAAAGLTESEFVGTIVATVAAKTGMIVGKEIGVRMGASLEDNLDNLIDAADYPAYDTLDYEEKNLWGTKENYDCAKFNSLLGAFGFEDLSDEYYRTYDASGGGNFNPDDDKRERLERIGGIGRRWALGLGNTFETVADTIDNLFYVYDFIGADKQYIANGKDVNGWPSSLPVSLPFGSGYTCIIDGNKADVTVGSTYPVYWVVLARKRSGATGTFYAYQFYSCSRGSYVISVNGTPYSEATEQTSTVGETFYSHNFSSSPGAENNEIACNQPYLVSPAYPSGAAWKAVGETILFGDVQIETSMPDDAELIEGYPETIPSDETVYYPEEGVKPGETWNVYITPPNSVSRPDNPYNPGDETGKQPWKDETEANVIPLQNIKFDKLFPFSLLYDVPKMVTKVKELTITGGDGDYDEIRIPLEAGNIDEDIVLDLQPVHELLMMIRPFILILLIVGLLMALVAFWRSILTG